MSSKIETKLFELINPLVDSLGLDLVEINFTANKKSRLAVFVDKQGGVDLDDLTNLNHLISDMLDAEDPIKGAYTLEVSSSGLDRPLKSERDFWRKVGEQVKIVYKNSEVADKTEEITGEIAAAENGVVSLKTADGTPAEVALADIIKGKLIY